jgi:hypothetical protein
MDEAMKRKTAVEAVRAAVAAGANVRSACVLAGISEQAYERWSVRFTDAGLDGLGDLKRSGRPSKCELTVTEADYLRSLYLKSNLRSGAGSMTLAARMAAKDPSSPLLPETRKAILDVNYKHALPQEIKRALRLGSAVFKRYRDPKSGQNDGIYTPGWLRMADDGTRRLVPGERQVWDDASVNVGVVVPWQRGGDKCSEKYGCRVARFQLLLGIDCATDFCVGYSYVMRNNDAYNASDVCAAFEKVWRMNGYAPDEMVLEGGAWQANRTLDLMAAAGVKVISAKGRPNQKLVEGWFNRLWTVMSIKLPTGQVGRFRGEMKTETAEWIACREGRMDPREHFPTITEFLRDLDDCIRYLNEEKMESRIYGSWVPADAYAERRAVAETSCPYGHRLESSIRQYALPVREVRTIRRGGLIEVSADCPFGWKEPYLFAMKEGYMFDGAKALVAFDPMDIQAGAIVELAERFQEWPKGHLIDEAAGCISAAPMIWHAADGAWTAGTLDAREDARLIKRGSRALIGAKAAAFDERGIKAKADTDDKGRQAFAIGNVKPLIREEEELQTPDWSALEKDLMIS